MEHRGSHLMKRVFFAAVFFVPMLSMATPLDGHEQRMADDARKARQYVAKQCLSMRAGIIISGVDAFDVLRLLREAVPCCVDPDLPQCGVPVKEHFDKRRFEEPECPDC